MNQAEQIHYEHSGLTKLHVSTWKVVTFVQNLSYLLQPKQFFKKLKSGIIKNLNYTAVDIRLSPWQNSDVVMITVQVYPSHENLITWNILCTDTNINTAPLSVESHSTRAMTQETKDDYTKYCPCNFPQPVVNFLL